MVNQSRKQPNIYLTLFLVFGGAGLAASCASTSDAPKPEAVQAATPSATPADQHLSATLQAAPKSKIKGTVELVPDESGVRVVATIEGLKKNSQHGFHIHEKGDCSAKDFSSAGAHFNPTNQPHGDHRSEQRHVGDFGNLQSDKQGKVNVSLLVPGLKGHTAEVAGKAIIIHAKADDLKTQPSGDSGARLACGVLAPATK